MANYIVTTLDDEAFNNGDLAFETGDGNGLSLREALALANGNAEADDITFGPGLVNGTLFLANGDLSLASDVTVDGDIDGNGTADITVDADSANGVTDAATRVFTIDGGATPLDVTLNGLVIRDGNVTGVSGGGVYLGSDDSLTLSNATITGNTMTSTIGLPTYNGAGGGVYAGAGSTLTVVDSTISNNRALGDIAFGLGGYGGGIFASDDAEVTVTGATIADNTANLGGGGMVLSANVVAAITGSAISGNNAAGAGGGIRMGADAEATITTTAITNNTANTGGGMFVGAYGGGQTVAVANSLIAGNAATGFGGGAAGFFNTDFIFINTTIANNVAGSVGGVGTSNTSSQLHYHSTITGNVGGTTGGINVNYQGTLVNSIVAGNYLPDGQTASDLSSGGLGGTITSTGVNLFGTIADSGAGSINGTADDIVLGLDGSAAQNVAPGTTMADIFAVMASFDPDGTPGSGDEFDAGVAADNGGPVQTIALNRDDANPAIDAATAALPADTLDLDGDADTGEDLPVDARGAARDVDFDGSGGTPDLGAFEITNVLNLVVTTLDDELDAADTDINTFDPNDLSLREALALANADPLTADSIVFNDGILVPGQPDLSGGTIFLTQGEMTISGDVSIDGDIDGDDVPDITIDADSSDGADDAASRIFDIESGGAAGGATVTINGLVIQNGVATGPDEDGGGIRVSADDALTLTNSSLLDNTSSSDGGGVSSEGSLTIINATVSGNHADDDGGGIDVDEGGVTLTDVTVTNNYAGYDGGGIFLDDGTHILTNVTVTGNTAYFTGGGIATYGDDVTITGSTISGNEAALGGGLYAYFYGAQTLSISDTQITGNTAYYAGGGLYLYGGTVTLTGVTVDDNEAGYAGGGIYGGGGILTISASSVTNNTVTGCGCGYGYGGGIYSASDLTVTNSTIAGNQVTAAYGAGGGVLNLYAATIANTTVSANSAGYFGGGIANYGLLVLANATIANNSVTEPGSFGGGIANYGAGYLYNSTVTGNSAVAAAGGVYGGGYLYSTNSIILGNTAPVGEEVDALPTLAGRNIIGTDIFNGAADEGDTTAADVFAAIDGATGGGLLADNGGPVETVLILANGAARDAGDNGVLPADAQDLDGDSDDAEDLPVDARGTPRIAGNFVDLGAVELQAPVESANAGLTLDEGASATIDETALDFDDADNTDDEIVYTITALPANGTLSLNNNPLGLNDIFTQDDLNNDLVGYEQDGSETVADSFGFSVSDGADTVAGQSFAITVNAVNDAPGGADATVATDEDTAYVFTAADFGFTDVDGDDLLAVRIATLPGAGSLANGGAGVTAGEVIAAADIANGDLVFTPGADDNGAGYASFTFQVQDDSGTANGGADLDPTPNTLAIDVNAVNDAPVIADLDGDGVTFTEDGGPVLLDAGGDATITDADSSNFIGGVLAVAYTGGQQAEDRLVIDTSGSVEIFNGNQIAVNNTVFGEIRAGSTGGAGEDLIIDILDGPSKANAQVVLRAIQYDNAGGDNPTDGDRTLSITVSDGDGATSSAATVTVNVASVNDDPVARDDAFATDELTPVNGAASLFADNGSGADDDPDNDPLSVTRIDGAVFTAGVAFALASGALLTMNAGGTFTWDPNGAFEFVPAAASGASNLTAQDSFTYTVDDGAGGSDTATVTITVTGVDNNDTVIGAGGPDTLNGGVLGDDITGLAGDDTIIGGPGDDLIDGGDDRDTTSYAQATQAVTVDLSTGQANGAETGADTLTSIEIVIGGSGDDDITGSDGTDWLDGGPGDDTLVGGGGVDSLYGSGGDDDLDGGDGADFLLGGTGNDTYRVDDTFDLVDEGGQFPLFAGGAGDFDTIISSADWYWDVHSVGESLAIADGAPAGATVIGSMFDNAMIGNAGDNILFGRGGTDSYRAGDGTDHISLSPLGVNDQNAFVGVDAANTVIVDPRQTGATSYDIVYEFEPGKDQIDVTGYGFATGADVLALGVDTGADSYYALGDGFDYLYMIGLNTAQMSGDDFIV